MINVGKVTLGNDTTSKRPTVFFIWMIWKPKYALMFWAALGLLFVANILYLQRHPWQSGGEYVEAALIFCVANALFWIVISIASWKQAYVWPVGRRDYLIWELLVEKLRKQGYHATDNNAGERRIVFAGAIDHNAAIRFSGGRLFYKLGLLRDNGQGDDFENEEIEVEDLMAMRSIDPVVARITTWLDGP